MPKFKNQQEVQTTLRQLNGFDEDGKRISIPGSLTGRVIGRAQGMYNVAFELDGKGANAWVNGSQLLEVV